jgi:hypothetical protein
MTDQMTSQQREWARLLSRESGSLAAQNIRCILATRHTTDERRSVEQYAEELSELRRRDDIARFVR